MNVLVLYQSRTGNTRTTAEAIAEAVQTRHYDVRVKSMTEVVRADVEAADMIFIGTWVQGFILFGVKPAGAESWVPALPDLTGKRVAVFCSYRFHPRGSLKTLSRMLEARGATVVGEHAFQSSEPIADVERFVDSVLHVRQRV